MSVWKRVQLSEKGRVTEDDGITAWRSTVITFGWGCLSVVSDVHVDDYTGKAVAHICHDDFKLPSHLITRLSIRLYWLCGDVMRDIDSDFGEALCDLESVVPQLFYHSDQERLMRKFRHAAEKAQ